MTIQHSDTADGLTTSFIDAQRLLTFRTGVDFANFCWRVAAMTTHGWYGRPILAIEEPVLCLIQALTGSHRIRAAQTLGMHVPVVVISTGRIRAAGANVTVAGVGLALVHPRGCILNDEREVSHWIEVHLPDTLASRLMALEA